MRGSGTPVEGVWNPTLNFSETMETTEEMRPEDTFVEAMEASSTGEPEVVETLTEDRMELEPQPMVAEAIETLVAEVISQAQSHLEQVTSNCNDDIKLFASITSNIYITKFFITALTLCQDNKKILLKRENFSCLLTLKHSDC